VRSDHWETGHPKEGKKRGIRSKSKGKKNTRGCGKLGCIVYHVSKCLTFKEEKKGAKSGGLKKKPCEKITRK